MKILNTDSIKNELINELEKTYIDSTLHILSMNPGQAENAYKSYIIKRCQEFNIKYDDKEFLTTTTKEEILAYTNQFTNKDGFIILLPFNDFVSLDYLRENIRLSDLDGFTYISQARAINGDYYALPATPKAVAKFIEKHSSIEAKNIVIANRSNLIGIPLASYLSKKGATTTIINSKTKNSKEIIKNADIFISAIGKADYYDKSFFKEGQLLIDVGTSEVNGKIKGDINLESLEDLDLELLTYKKGIGAITTLILLQTMIEKR